MTQRTRVEELAWFLGCEPNEVIQACCCVHVILEIPDHTRKGETIKYFSHADCIERDRMDYFHG